jgi:hypothetical protein
LGGTPLGGTVFPNINYVERRTFFTQNYGCRTNSGGVSVPYAVFTNFEKSVDFIQSWYKGFYQTNPLLFKWDTKDDFKISLPFIWGYYWPTKKFDTPEQFQQWAIANKSSADLLARQASEVVEKSISLGLISF